ncbi:MAG: hypothetical protein PWQ59_2301 [Thermoanaerobacterium sp.]|nr:hypothetical protein [Thermoanaerobacterium sp.]
MAFGWSIQKIKKKINMYNFVEIGIDDTNFKVMAEKACRGDVLQGFKHLTPKDVENIFRMCL